MKDLRSTASAAFHRVAGRLSEAGMGPNRWAPETKVAQTLLKFQWMGSKPGPFPLASAGFRVFSQFDEDGLLLAVFSLIGEGTRTFVDLGSSDGVNSNCANLAINHGWWGLFVDGDAGSVEQGRRFYEAHADTWLYPPLFVNADINRESINSIIQRAGLSGEIDLLSIDIDGNDYWIWHALEEVTPRVVIIETHVEFGLRNVVVPYDPDYRYPGSDPDYHGASPTAMEALAAERGYRLVGTNVYGFNTIWIRGEEGLDSLPARPAESILAHRRNVERSSKFERMKDRPFVLGGTGFPGTPASGFAE